MRLTKFEQETIILYNEAEKAAVVETCNPALRKRLDRYCETNDDIEKIESDEYCAKYTCPKKWVRVQMPPILSDEERERRSQRFHEYMALKNNRD